MAGMGTTSKLSGIILLLAMLFSMLGCVMDWIQVDYSEPTALWARKNWTTVPGATGADWENEIATSNAANPYGGNQGYESGQTEGAQASTDTAWTLKHDEFPVYNDGGFGASSKIGTTNGDGTRANIDSNSLVTAEVEVDSTLWKYCKEATGGEQDYSSTNTTITQPVMVIDCQTVADMEGDDDTKMRLQAGQAFSLMAIVFGIVALFAAFSPKAKCCGCLPAFALALIAALCAVITIGVVSCSSQSMEDEGKCVFPYHDLRDDVRAREYPGVGMICEVFAVLFFFIGGVTSYVGNKLDSSARHAGDPGKF